MSGLDCTAPVPRVNAELMGQYVGKRVKLVGRVEGAEGSTLRLRAPDETVVTVNMANPVPQSQYVEVEGVVNSAANMTEETCTPFGDNFDLSNYNQMCKLAAQQQYRHIFMP
ncbi:replication A 14 kDa subunit B [Micractinium conductrix]|uniref:Replication A 14 kDa subunit B n=1 Tax=Micractinium conductrix TaxID=554055 RepID=A0A2P6VFB7_9CHLO|nr:replication A 14 kDa subunit B [Micractinium conductrix]|eukprot:PSC72767.1 replication A 14 kDa subunit B [Micractinium conductrix]